MLIEVLEGKRCEEQVDCFLVLVFLFTFSLVVSPFVFPGILLCQLRLVICRIYKLYINSTDYINQLYGLNCGFFVSCLQL